MWLLCQFRTLRNIHFPGRGEGLSLWGWVCSGKALKPFLWPSLRVCVGCGAAGVALAVPLLSLSVSRPVGCLALSLSYCPAFRLAVPPGLALGCCPSLPHTLATVFCLSGGVLLRLALGRRGVVLGALLLTRARFFDYM